MASRYKIALKKEELKKKDQSNKEVQQALETVGGVEIIDGVKVSDRNPKKEKELFLASLLSQAVEETGVPVQSPPPPTPEQTEFIERWNSGPGVQVRSYL